MEPRRAALISGISGQIGWYLAQHLHAEGYDVYGFVQPHAGVHRGLTEEGYVQQELPFVKTLMGDALDAMSITRAVCAAEFDEIYWLSAWSQPGLHDDLPVLGFDVNALGVMRLLDCLAGHIGGAQIHLVHASSDAIFGNAAAAPQDAETPIRPLTYYGVSKAAAHMAVQVARRQGLKASNAILFNAISPRQKTGVAFHVARQVAAIRRGKPGVVTLRDPEARRDFTFAGDVAAALALIGRSDVAMDVLVGSGVSLTIRELAQVALDAAGEPAEIVAETKGVGGFAAVSEGAFPQADTRAIQRLGWKETRTIGEVMRSMVEAAVLGD